MCLSVGLLVCLSAFYRPHDICPLCGAASECPRAAKPSREAPRARASACAARARTRMPYNFSTKKSLRWCLSKTISRTRAHAVVYVTAEIFKKGKKKTNMPLPKFSLQPSLGVFTFRIVLNRILHKSSLLAPMESRRTRRPTFTAEERLERRREQDRRRHAERRAGERREQTQARRDVDRLRSSHLETQQLLDDLQRIQSWLFM